jgi:hypothetical protein
VYHTYNLRSICRYERERERDREREGGEREREKERERERERDKVHIPLICEVFVDTLYTDRRSAEMLERSSLRGDPIKFTI